MTTATNHSSVVIVSVACSFTRSSDFDIDVSPDSPSRMPVTLMRIAEMEEISELVIS